MPNIDERLLAGKTLRPEEEGEAAEELKNRRNGGEKEENQGGSLRQRVQAARQAMDLKAKAKQKLEEKVAAPARKLSKRLLNLIPGYGPYVAFKQAVLMKKGKFTLVDIIIMLFSNLAAFFTVLAVLVFISLIVTWATDPITAFKAIMNLGWGAVSVLVGLFKGLLLVK